MATRKSFIPRTDKAKAIWLKNFALKFGLYANQFGFLASDVTSVTNDSAAFSYQLDILAIFASEMKERTSFKDLLRDGPIGTTALPNPTMPTLPNPPATVPAGIFPRISKLAKRIKTFASYTDSIGIDLGIVAPGDSSASFRMDEKKPALALTTDGGDIIVKYKKAGMEGIRLLSRRAGETDFTLLAVVTQVTYKDTRPNVVVGTPEVREYSAWYIEKDALTGQVSDVVSITL